MRQPFGLEFGYDRGRFALERVFDADYPGERSAYRQIQQRVALRLLRGCGFLFVGPLRAFVVEYEVAAAYYRLFSAQARRYAVRDHVFYFGVLLLVAQLLLRGFADDGARYRMREVLFEAGGEAQHLFAAASAEGHDLCDARLGGGQRAGLVEDRGVRLRHGFDVLSALYEHAVFDALAHRGEYRERRRYLYRAGVVDHYRRRRALGAAREEIDRRGEREVVGHYRVGKLFGLALDGCLAPLGFLDDPDYFVYPRRSGGGCDFNRYFALFDRGSRVDARSGAADYAERLARHRGLVDDGFPFGDRAVGRDYRAGADYEQVSRAQLGEGYLNLSAVFFNPDAVDAQREALR